MFTAPGFYSSANMGRWEGSQTLESLGRCLLISWRRRKLGTARLSASQRFCILNGPYRVIFI